MVAVSGAGDTRPGRALPSRLCSIWSSPARGSVPTPRALVRPELAQSGDFHGGGGGRQESLPGDDELWGAPLGMSRALASREASGRAGPAVETRVSAGAGGGVAKAGWRRQPEHGGLERRPEEGAESGVCRPRRGRAGRPARASSASPRTFLSPRGRHDTSSGGSWVAPRTIRKVKTLTVDLAEHECQNG